MKEWYKLCPYCANEIKEWAIKCQYCWEFLNGTEKTERESKECPFCKNNVDVDAIKCPFCDEKLWWEKENREIKNVVWYKNRRVWIILILLINAFLLLKIIYGRNMSPSKWWESFWSGLVRYLIVIFAMEIIMNLIKKIWLKEDRFNNSTKNKLTSAILYILWYVGVSFFIAYFWLYS